MKETKVVKFGGSSLADANQFKKVADIILADSARRFVVASAPGKRFVEDILMSMLILFVSIIILITKLLMNW